MGWLFTHAPQLIDVGAHERILINFEFFAIQQLCERICGIHCSGDLFELDLIAISHLAYPPFTYVDELHFACSPSVLEETLCCGGIDVDEMGLRKRRPWLVRYISDVEGCSRE